MVATPLYYLKWFSPSRRDLGCDRWRLHWGSFGESILLVKCAKGMLFLYIRFPLFCFISCIFIYLCLSWCHVYSLISSYDYIVKIIEPYGRRQLLYLSRNFLVILHVWVWVVLGRGGKTGWAQRASPSARAKRNGLG